MAAVIFGPFAAAAATPVVYRLLGERTAYAAAAVAGITLSLVTWLTVSGAHGLVAWTWIDAPGFEVSLSFYVDGLSLLIGFLASGIGVLILTYSGGYMHDEPGKMKFYATLLAFMGSMLGVAFAADLIVLFVFWELTSISSFILIGHYTDETSSQYAARKSMLITVAGGLFMLLGFLLLAGEAGTFQLLGTDAALIDNAESVREGLGDAGLFVPALVLIGIGAAAKSAQVPLHIWLPNAMEAPTPVSAFLHSATMVKAGVYLVGRFRPLMATEEWQLLFVAMGLVTMTVAAILAVGASDIKELLAYSTASHLGLIIAGFGIVGIGAGTHGTEIGAYGAETGAFHILNHAAFKAALFLVAGIVAHEAGTRMIGDLGGLWRDLPIAAGVTVVAALGMAGVPPFNGFYSKELLFEATYELAHASGGLWWALPVVAVFGSVFTFLYSIRFLMLFFGEKPDALGHVHAPPWSMRLPAVVLAVVAGIISIGGITAAFGVHLVPVEDFVARVVEATAVHSGDSHGAHFSYYLPTDITPPVLMSAATIGLGVIAYPFYGQLRDVVRRLRSVPVLSANWYYDSAVDGVDRSRFVDTKIQTGLLRTYALMLVLAVSSTTLLAYGVTAISIPEFLGLATTIPIVVVLGVAIVAAVAVTRASSHISGVLMLSILGFMVAIFYILGDAPDLALTQLLIETLVLVLFLLVLDKLPAFYGEARRALVARDAVVSGIVGVTVFLTVLVSSGANPDGRIAEYFLDNGGVPAEHGAWIVDYGGGANIVNVILVDFRAFDTLGEISVVAMAALSVITLIAMRERGETQ
ncbi:MAG: hydrogen gas-evolving membrane-bound hydrogenase subunit E [Halapricum sp.]